MPMLDIQVNPISTAVSDGAAWLYSQFKYGTIPVPGSGSMPSSAINPAAPTSDQFTSYSPDDMAAAIPGQQQAVQAAQTAAIQAAINNGSYDPTGGSSNWALFAICAVGLVLVLVAAKEL
jgi:hypothetical protein